MNIFKKILAATVLLSATVPASAQMIQTPYSMYGYGVLNDHVSSAQRSMGGIGYALRSSRQINVKNPASYAAIDSMTFLFDIGANCGVISTTENSLSGSKPIGGLDYVTLQVPVTKWMGVSAGLLPYSTVRYKFGSEIANGESAYQGSGGISEAYIGVGAEPVKGLSLGVNAGYLFGNVINDVYVNAENGSVSLYEKVLKVRDYNIQFGLQYGLTFKHEHTITIGATYTLGKDTHGTGYGVIYDVSNTTNKPDTIGLAALKHGFSMPWSVGGGIAYEWDKRLTVGVDFTYQPWSKARFNGIEGFSSPVEFADRYKGAIGAEYIPSLRGGYFRRIAYRVGAYYSRDYMMIGSNNVNEFGISLGFGLPTPMRTKVNLGLEYRHRNTSPAATVSENYFMVTLGVAINEAWFVPSRIR